MRTFALLLRLALLLGLMPGLLWAQEIQQKLREQPEVSGAAGMSIIGDRELPSVLYIVPWKRPSLGPAAAGEPPPEEAMAPTLELIDPEVLDRELAYRAHLRKIAK